MKRFIYFFLFIICPISNYSQSRGELEKQRAKMLNEISEAENILTEVQKNRNQSVELLNIIDRKISTRNKLITNISKDLSKVSVSIKDLEDQINSLNKDVFSLKNEYAKVIWLSYLNRKKLNQIMFILSARDFNQAYRRLKYFKQYSNYRKHQIKSILDLQIDLGKKLVELDIQKSEKSKLLTKTEIETNSLNKELNVKSGIVKNLKKREKQLLKSIKDKNRIAAKLKSEIEKLIRREIEANNARAAKNKKSNSGKSNSNNIVNALTPEEQKLSSTFKDNKGRLPWPTERGIITGYFGEHSHPVYRTVKIRNDGIDISTIEGSDVRAIFEGEVRYVVPILGANYSVLIRHGNYYTVYSNVVDVKVRTGDKVSTKQALGKVFTDKYSNATILHVELWDNLTRLDPQLWLSKN